MKAKVLALIVGLAVIGFGLLMILVVPLTMFAALSGSSAATTACSSTSFTVPIGTTTGPVSGTYTDVHGKAVPITLDATQVSNAALIVQAAQAAGLNGNAAVIGLMTALDESKLRNLANPFVPESMQLPHDGVGSNGTSLGLFQQNNGFGGGHTAADRMNPLTSAGYFFTALAAVPGWQSMSKNDAAQAVQRSGTPTAYAGFEQLATTLLGNLEGAGTAPGAQNAVATSPATQTATPPPSAAAPADPAGGAATCVGSSGGATFLVGELNVLGADRTACQAGNGTCQYPAWPDVTARSVAQAAAIANSGVSVITLQEVQKPGLKALRKALGSTWQIEADPNDVNDSAVAWRTDTWAAVSTGTIASPWYRGSSNQLPWVLLQNLPTSQQIIVLSAHTVALGVYGASVADQHKAFDAIAAGWKSTFTANYPGIPVILGGDFNNDTLPCYLGPQLGTVDAAGTTSSGTSCTIPAAHHDPTEWVESTADVSWRSYVDDNSLNGNVAGAAVKATDHDFDYATATIGATGGAGGIESILAQGKGGFTDTGQVVGAYTADVLLQRAARYASAKVGWTDNGAHGTYDTSVDYSKDTCQHFTANLAGYGTSNAPNRGWAIDLWNWYTAQGLAHPASSAGGMSPAVGSQLYFDTGAGRPGHVVVYLGANRVISTDTAPDGSYSPGRISVVSDASFWGFHYPYLGWAPPVYP